MNLPRIVVHYDGRFYRGYDRERFVTREKPSVVRLESRRGIGKAWDETEPRNDVYYSLEVNGRLLTSAATACKVTDRYGVIHYFLTEIV